MVSKQWYIEQESGGPKWINHSNISCTFLQNPKISRKSEIPEIQNKKSQRKPHEFQKIPKKIPRNSKYQKKNTKNNSDVNKIPEIGKTSKKLNGNQKRFQKFQTPLAFQKVIFPLEYSKNSKKSKILLNLKCYKNLRNPWKSQRYKESHTKSLRSK